MKKDSKPKKEFTNQLDQEIPKWFAIYTLFRREKMVNRMLLQKGIESYLPLKKVTRRYSKKIREQELPLLNCYLFVKITKSEYIKVLETEHVLKFIKIGKNLLCVTDEEIEIIKKITGEGLPIEIDPSKYVEGDLVEVTSGNLVGLRGTLVSKEGKKRFSIVLDNLGCTLKMTIDPSILRRVNQPAIA